MSGFSVTNNRALFPTIVDYYDHPALIEEWKQNLVAAAYEKALIKMLRYHQLRKQLIVMIKLNTGQQE